MATKKADQATGIDPHRVHFTQLISINPNHFGNVTGSPFVVVSPKSGDTTYEELGCVAYSPERARLEATIVVKRPSGYGSGTCGTGSKEYVRFYVLSDLGVWVDAGMSVADTYDLPLGNDCAGAADHPYTHAVGVGFSSWRRRCSSPALLRVRAILSWQQEPPAGAPDWKPAWGEVQDATIQLAPRLWLDRTDLREILVPLKIDEAVLNDLFDNELADLAARRHGADGAIGAHPEPGVPLPPQMVGVNACTAATTIDAATVAQRAPLSLQRLAKLYSPDKLEHLAAAAADPEVARLLTQPPPPHRFAASTVFAATHTLDAASITSAAASLATLGIDWSKVAVLLEDGKGDTTYEELECIGLDNRAQQLVATYRIKRPTGFSGGPCSPGSREHVAFWGDFDDDCSWTYLGSTSVAAHDFKEMPAGGLSYAAVLPIDVDALRRHCDRPGLHRVRAVLSWSTPPSTTDPDAVPHWGNRLDTHVHVLPGVPYDGVARMTIVGGVATDEIDPVTGVTKPVAHIAYNGMPLDPRGCPFGGRVVVHGPNDPALAGSTYRITVRNVSAGGTSRVLTTPFLVVDADGFTSTVTPNALDGSVPWPTWNTNTLGTLGYFDTAGDDRWEVSLEVGPSFTVADRQVVQLDNTIKQGPSSDAVDHAGLDIDAGQVGQQACGKFTQGMVIEGTFDAGDRWLRNWSLGVSGAGAVLTTSSTDTSGEAPFGSTWSLDTAGMAPCAYTITLTVTDRAVVNSVGYGHYAQLQHAFCLDAAH